MSDIVDSVVARNQLKNANEFEPPTLFAFCFASRIFFLFSPLWLCGDFLTGGTAPALFSS